MTDLMNSRRVKKTSKEIKTLGLIDELNCFLGALKAELKTSAVNSRLKSDLENAQRTLIKISAVMAGMKFKGGFKKETTELEALINDLSKKVGPLKEFILPGKNKSEAAAHLARAKTRTAEIAVRELKKFNPSAVYLNRLSDYLFLVAVLMGKT